MYIFLDVPVKGVEISSVYSEIHITSFCIVSSRARTEKNDFFNSGTSGKSADLAGKPF